MYRTIREEFCAHIIKVIADLEIIPVLLKHRVFNFFQFIPQVIEPVKCFFLQFITQPGGQVSLFICPGDGMGDLHCRDDLQVVGHLGWLTEGKICIGKYSLRQSFQELKDAGFFPLVLTESFIIHEQVNRLLILADLF